MSSRKIHILQLAIKISIMDSMTGQSSEDAKIYAVLLNSIMKFITFRTFGYFVHNNLCTLWKHLWCAVLAVSSTFQICFFAVIIIIWEEGRKPFQLCADDDVPPRSPSVRALQCEKRTHWSMQTDEEKVYCTRQKMISISSFFLFLELPAKWFYLEITTRLSNHLRFPSPLLGK